MSDARDPGRCPARLVHLVATTDWADARGSDAYLPSTFETDGFIHLSGIDQLLTPANRFYRGRRDLVALVVDAHLLGNAVVWEPGTGTDELFPHLYAALPLDAVIAEVPFPPDEDGAFAIPPTLRRHLDPL